MFEVDRRLFNGFYEKNLIAFGTGKIGKAVIPYLARESTIRLIGVTNSRIVSNDEGMFLDTGLPLRSVQSWAKIAPDASILVTAIKLKDVEEIFSVCRKAGFQEIIPILPCISDPIRIAMPVQLLAGDPMLEVIGLANEIRETHTASFSEFKGCHRGQTVAVVGAGPTLNYYPQVKGVPHIGVNGSFRREQLKLDYYFLHHYSLGFCEELKDYSFVKFFGYLNYDVFPEYVIEENHARKYFHSTTMRKMHTNIEHYPLAGFGSIIFQALQFAIYTRPKQILLVGCDCANTGHFIDYGLGYGDNFSDDLREWLNGYRCFKEFITQYYPDTEIISVNPVGLKGMFRDMYTENYLDAHPELDRAQCEILDPADFEGN